MLTALDALKAANLEPSVNLRFLFEGEEEAGSQHLGQILERHRDLVTGDVWLICDGPVHQTRQQQIYFGARGVTGLNVTVYGPRHELHSGHYGGWAINPAMALAKLLASMTDDHGRVTMRGFSDGIAPLEEIGKQAIAASPSVDEMLRQEFLLGATENAPRSLAELINEPALNIHGFESASAGGFHNVIPAQATAAIGLRLVKGEDPKEMVEKVIAHIQRQGYFVVRSREPDAGERLAHLKVARIDVERGGYRAVRTSMALPVSNQVIRAVEAARGPVVKMPTLGGSVPLALIEDAVGVPMIGIPIVNHDNSQHSANENLRLQNLWDGIELMAGLFTMQAQ
jgi:acetylornithine deacetylase/succinyl-diaminopimelate desuccinylase-like protein